MRDEGERNIGADTGMGTGTGTGAAVGAAVTAEQALQQSLDNFTQSGFEEVPDLGSPDGTATPSCSLFFNSFSFSSFNEFKRKADVLVGCTG